MVEPTETERQIGLQLTSEMTSDIFARTLAEDIAQALADQRARYEALADELDREAGPFRYAARRIRAVSRG